MSDGGFMTPEEREQKIEAEARRIARDHDADPDDGRLGYPAWRIPWILEQAAAIVDEQLPHAKEG